MLIEGLNKLNKWTFVVSTGEICRGLHYNLEGILADILTKPNQNHQSLVSHPLLLGVHFLVEICEQVWFLLHVFHSIVETEEFVDNTDSYLHKRNFWMAEDSDSFTDTIQTDEGIDKCIVF